MNFLDFVKNKQIIESHSQMLNEAFKESELNKALDLMTKLFKKNITSGKVLKLEGHLDTKIDNKNCKSIIYLIYKEGEKNADQLFALNFLTTGKSSEVYSISFFDKPDLLWGGTDKAKTTVFTMGASVVYFMPLIYHIVNNKDYKVGKKDMEKYAKNILVKESFRTFYIGALEYHIYEGLSDDYILEQYDKNIDKRINEVSDELKDAKNKIHDKVKEIRPQAKELAQKGHPEIWKNLEHDYYAIVKAIKGGAENISDLDIEFRSDLVVQILQANWEKSAQAEIDKAEEEHEDPDVAWKEMRQYIKMIIKGINPSCIVCGAAGLGKTWKIKKQLKAAGYQEGQNLWTIKGKCSPRQLYLALYEFQNKGDIVLIDDADSLVGPKAPEDVINILKAALDSSDDDEGRLVSYMISGKLEDNEGNPVPKKFYYRGGVIVITNYRAGQLDTALRSRSFVQDIHFTTEDILLIIKRLLPELGDGKWSMESKEKAYKYIEQIASDKNNEVELSIRTFGICAKLFESCADDPEFTDDDCGKMIAKQLKMQAARGGKKY